MTRRTSRTTPKKKLIATGLSVAIVLTGSFVLTTEVHALSVSSPALGTNIHIPVFKN